MENIRARALVQSVALWLIAVSACVGNESVLSPETRTIIDIDGEPWILTRESAECEAREAVAIAQYWKAPIFNEQRWVTPDRYLVNNSSDCWIELSVVGITEPSAIFRVSQDNVVRDARLFYYWIPRIRPYPEEPIHDY